MPTLIHFPLLAFLLIAVYTVGAMEGVVLLVCAILLTVLPTISHANPEVDALIAFKAGLRDPFNALESWDPTLVDPCTWFHITCNENNNVIRVDLGNYRLSGPLVPQLGNLASLQYLELYRNNLLGPIPKQLGNLKQLISLDLFQNNIAGPIPSELGLLSNLRFLRTNDNKLSGSIPPSLTNIASLVVLNLSSNHLSGQIPTGGSFTQFPAESFLGNPGLCGAVIRKPC